jgi:hypothetical protein
VHRYIYCTCVPASAAKYYFHNFLGFKMIAAVCFPLFFKVLSFSYFLSLFYFIPLIEQLRLLFSHKGNHTYKWTNIFFFHLLVTIQVRTLLWTLFIQESFKPNLVVSFLGRLWWKLFHTSLRFSRRWKTIFKIGFWFFFSLKSLYIQYIRY